MKPGIFHATMSLEIKHFSKLIAGDKLYLSLFNKLKFKLLHIDNGTL